MSQPPVLTERDRAFLNGESRYDEKRLPRGRLAELREICQYWGEEEISHELTLHVVRTPDGKLWGYCQGIIPGEDNWYDDTPLFPVEEHTETVTRTWYTQPGGERLPDSVLRC